MPTEPAYAQTMLNLHEEARLEGARIFDRETLAAYWLAKFHSFTDRLEPEADPTLVDIIAACQEHYELYA